MRQIGPIIKPTYFNIYYSVKPDSQLRHVMQGRGYYMVTTGNQYGLKFEL